MSILRKLEAAEIQKILLRNKDCKAEAVYNFLSTCDGMSYGDAIENIELDAKLYKWNAHTVRAIGDGVHLAAEAKK